MRVEASTDGKVVTLIVSRSNLISLLGKVDGNPPDSACTISSPATYSPRVFLTAETDEVHYSHPDRDKIGARGRMIPETEAFISATAHREFGTGLRERLGGEAFPIQKDERP